MRRTKFAAAAALASLLLKPGLTQADPAPASVPTYTMAPFGTVTLYRPAATPRGLAIFLSGDGGWNAGVVDMAAALNRQGLAVAGVSTPALMRALEKDPRCIDISYPLAALAQDSEHRLGFRNYIKPIVVGYSSGATLAYAGLAQSPPGTFKAAVSLGFGPDMPGTTGWCTKNVLKATPITSPEKGWLFAPAVLPSPWIVFQGLTDQVVSPAVARSFTAATGGARLVELPKVGHGYSVQANWMPQFEAAIAALIAAPEPSPRPARASIALPTDLPLDIVADPQARHTDVMAVLYSGDGGWAGLDRDVAGELARAGVPVVGIDSLSYYWNAKTPAGAAADLERVIDAYGAAWDRPKVLLIGYSFGADDLAYIVNHLSPMARARVVRVSLLGLSPTADFQFHMTSWLDFTGPAQMPTLPAVTALRGLSVQCIRGEAEKDSACNAVPAGILQVIPVPGGHHFDQNAPLLAGIVSRGLRL